MHLCLSSGLGWEKFIGRGALNFKSNNTGLLWVQSVFTALNFKNFHSFGLLSLLSRVCLVGNPLNLTFVKILGLNLCASIVFLLELDQESVGFLQCLLHWSGLRLFFGVLGSAKLEDLIHLDRGDYNLSRR